MLAHVLAAGLGSWDGTRVALMVGGVVVWGILSWYFSKGERRKRKLRRAPVRQISTVQAGERVRVIGTARVQGEPLTAPLTGRTCLYYCVEVEAKKGKYWETIIREARGVPFLVDDGSGSALVDPRRADVVLDTDVRDRSGAFDSGSPLVAKFLARHAERRTGLRFSPNMGFSEAIIKVGGRVAVLGAPRRAHDPAAREPVELSGSAEARLVISDARSTTRE